MQTTYSSHLTTTTPVVIRNLSNLIPKLNHERMLFQLPVIVVLGIVFTFAFFGNITVVYVYHFRLKKNSSGFLITILGMLDLCSTICIPFVMFDLAHPYMYPIPVLCKIVRFMESFSNISSGFVLVGIALDRYFHVCYPLRGYSVEQAKTLTTISLTMALSVSWPMFFIIGKRTVKTPVEGIFGEDCSYADGLYNSIYTLYVQASFILIFILCFSIIFFVYVRVFFTIFRRRHLIIGEHLPNTPKVGTNDKKDQIQMPNMDVPSSPGGLSLTEKSVDNNKSDKLCLRPDHDEKVNSQEVELSGRSENDRVISGRKSPTMALRTLSNSSSVSANRMTSGQHGAVKIRTSRTTAILVVVTISVICGFLPYPIITVLQNIGKYFQPGMSRSEDLAYEFGTKSYFMNNAVNPIIYSVMNPAFRREGIAAWVRLFKIPRAKGVCKT